MLTRVLSALGRTFIGAGLLLLLFVAYQLWGTGLHEARAQSDLDRQFTERLDAVGGFPATTIDVAKTASPPADKATGATSSGETPTTTSAGSPLAPSGSLTVKAGDALGRIRIPAIGVDKLIVEGVNVGDLRKAPGHYPNTAMPGTRGNAGIAGHRTTYGAPFGDIDQLEVGDEIQVTTLQGTWTYRVIASPDDPSSAPFVVSPEEVSVLRDFGDNRLTLTACHPKFSARQRIIVAATLVDPPAPPLVTTTPPVPSPGDPSDGAGNDPATVVDDETLDRGLGGDPTARTPAILWGLVFLMLLVGVPRIARRWRRWPTYAAAFLPLAVVVFVWFEQVDRWMPAR